MLAETPASPQPGSKLHFTATAYCKGETTASGVPVRTGIAAADPTLLPVGTVVRLDMPDSRYDGIWTIKDTGPAVQGRIVDLYLWSCHDALRFGRRPIELTVLRLGWNPQNSEPGRADTLYRQREVERARLPIPAKPVDPEHTLTPPAMPAVSTQPPPD
jgi:3D (Asp-Asp-Asp) domain-containing protein